MLAKKKTVKILIIVEKLISDVLFWDIFSVKWVFRKRKNCLRVKFCPSKQASNKRCSQQPGFHCNQWSSISASVAWGGVTPSL